MNHKLLKKCKKNGLKINEFRTHHQYHFNLLHHLFISDFLNVTGSTTALFKSSSGLRISHPIAIALAVKMLSQDIILSLTPASLRFSAALLNPSRHESLKPTSSNKVMSVSSSFSWSCFFFLVQTTFLCHHPLESPGWQKVMTRL